MAETTDDVRRDIELTRERMSSTFAQLEQKLNVMEMVKANPWPALALAVGAGVLLRGSRADVKSAAVTLSATKGASSRLGTVLDDLVSQVMGGFHGAIEQRIEGLANDVKRAIGAPAGQPRGGMSGGVSSLSSSMGGTGADLSGGFPRAD